MFFHRLICWWVYSSVNNTVFYSAAVAGGMAQYKNQPTLDGKTYESWKNEICMWNELTDLAKEKWALAIAVSLSGRAKECAMEIDVTVLKRETEVTDLLNELDILFKLDKVDLAYSAYKRFDSYSRPSDLSMAEFIIEFEKRYTSAKRHLKDLPDTILAFKLLDNANLDASQKQLALTACSISDCSFKSMKSALNRIFGSVSAPNQGESENNDINVKEEAMSSRGSFRYRGRGRNHPGQFSTFQRGTNDSSRGAFKSKQNPVINGAITRCNICESTYHYERFCRHKSDAVASKQYVTERSEENNEVNF